MKNFSKILLLTLTVLTASEGARADTFFYQCQAKDGDKLVVELLFPRTDPDRVLVGKSLSDRTVWPLSAATVTEIDGASYACYVKKSSPVLPKEVFHYCLAHDLFNGLSPSSLILRHYVREDLVQGQNTEKVFSCKLN